MFEKTRVWDVGIAIPMMVYVVELPLLLWLVDIMQLISSRGYQINRRMLNRIKSGIKYIVSNCQLRIFLLRVVVSPIEALSALLAFFCLLCYCWISGILNAVSFSSTNNENPPLGLCWIYFYSYYLIYFLGSNLKNNNNHFDSSVCVYVQSRQRSKECFYNLSITLYVKAYLFWLFSQVSVSDVETIREGHQSEVLRSLAEEFPAECCFTVVFYGRRSNLDLIASSAKEAQCWIQGLRRLIETVINMDQKERLDQYPYI